MNNLAKAIEKMKRIRREQFKSELRREKRVKGYVIKDNDIENKRQQINRE